MYLLKHYDDTDKSWTCSSGSEIQFTPSSHFALKSPKEKRLWTAYFMTCWLCVLFHGNNWILTALLKLCQAHVSDLCACELMHTASISMMSSLLSFLFTDGLIWPSSTLCNQDTMARYLWYLTLHNNSWFFFLFRSSQQSIRTLTTGYALSSLFVPGDRHVVVGTKVYQFRWDSFFIIWSEMRKGLHQLQVTHLRCSSESAYLPCG